MIAIEEIRNKYGTEIALLLLCCRVHFGTESRQSLQQFLDASTINWNNFLSLSDYHRVEPVVFKILSTIANIPSDIAASIKQKQHYLIHQSFQRAVETERLILLLNLNHIRCIPYKGAVFSKQFYGDLSSRESSDIDLVISPDDFKKVYDLMLEDGYSFGNQLEYEYYKEQIFRRKKDLNFAKYKNGARQSYVEFHWRLSDRELQIKEAANALLFQHTVQSKLIHNSIEIIKSDAHFLAVFIHHSNNDAFSTIRNVLDICQINFAQPDTVDFQFINEGIANLNLNPSAAICQYLSDELFGVSIPFSLKNKVNISQKIKEHFTDHLLRKELSVKHFKVQLYSKSVLYLKQTFSEKIKYLGICLQLRFTPSIKDLRTFNFPKPLYFLYYIIKPFRSLFSPADSNEEKEIIMIHNDKDV